MKRIILILITALAASTGVSAADQILDRTGWMATDCADETYDPASLLDNDPDTYWRAAPQKEGQWVAVDMQTPQTFNQVVLSQNTSPGDYPRGFAIQVSDDGSAWNTVFVGTGKNANSTIIDLETQTARYIRLYVLCNYAMWWKVNELNLVLIDDTESWKLWTAAAIVEDGVTWNETSNMFDNDNNTRWNTSQQKPGQWVIVDMKQPQSFNQIDLFQNGGDYPRGYQVYVSDNALDWGSPLAEGSGKDFGKPDPRTLINLTRLQTRRFVKIVQTETDGGYWSINEFSVHKIENPNYRFGWTMQAHNTDGDNLPYLAFDGNTETRWASGQVQAPGHWIVIDMKNVSEVNRLRLDLGSSQGDYPRGYKVYVSSSLLPCDSEDWGEAIITGEGSETRYNYIDFATVQQVRCIKIEQTGTSGGWWGFYEIDIYKAPTDGTLDRFGWTASHSGNDTYDTANLLDGDNTTSWNAAPQRPGQWFMVDLQTAQTFNQIILDQTGTPGDFSRGYAVYVSNDGVNWGNPVTLGAGYNASENVIDLPVQIARYVKMEVLVECPMWWKVFEFNLKLTTDTEAWKHFSAVSFYQDGVTWGETRAMFDNDNNTRWNTSTQQPGQWVIIDMKQPQTFNQIDLFQNGGDYPRGYEVYLSENGLDWGNAVLAGAGRDFSTGDPRTLLSFASLQTTRFVKLVQTATDGVYWSINEFSIHKIDNPEYRFGWQMTAHNTDGPNVPFLALDGNSGTRWASGVVQAPGQWIVIDMKAPKEMHRIKLDLGTSAGDYPRGYKVYLSDNALSGTSADWGEPIVTGTGSETRYNYIDLPSFPSARCIKIEQTGTSGGWWGFYEIDVLSPLKTAAVVAPGQSLSYDDYANGGYTDIIFEADDENGVGGMTDIPAGGFTVNGTMKLVKTVKSDKWYSMGFPFDVSAITDASLQTIVPGNGETGDFEMKKYDSENPLFQYTAEVVDAGKGYILKFPAKYNNAEITFCSSPKPTVGNLVLTVTDDFTHIANPGFTNLTFTQGEGDKYYYVLSETKDALDNLFKRSETGVSLTVKPFEAFFAIHWTSTEKVPPMTITSQPDVIDIVGVSGKGDLISTTYYNLRGEVVKNPEEGLLYIVIQTYLSGAQSVSKQFYRK